MAVIDDVARRLVAFFDAHSSGVAAVYVFGSLARAQARPDSDVDVGVLFNEPPARTLEAQPYALEGDLERQLGRPVDVDWLNDAPVDLRIRVLRQGRLVFESNRPERIRFEVDTRNEAFDLEPILSRYRAPQTVSR